MKQAEEWIDEQTGLQTSRIGAISWAKQLQLDAYKQACTDMARLISVTPATKDRQESRAWYVKSILSARDNKTTI